MKTLFLAHDTNETAVLGFSFESEQAAYDSAESFGFEADTVTEVMCPDHMDESDFSSCSSIAEYQNTAEEEIPELVKLLIKNGLDWYVCHTEDGDFELKHASAISNIIECGHSCEEYGYTKIDRCWNGVDLSDETYW